MWKTGGVRLMHLPNRQLNMMLRFLKRPRGFQIMYNHRLIFTQDNPYSTKNSCAG